jgi:replicative DNA helicase
MRAMPTYEPIPVAGRVPPHDLDAGGAVLAAILLERDALDRVVNLLKPEQFYSDANRRIFEAATQLAAVGTPIDITTVAAFLRDREWMNHIGGPSYLVQLVDATPSVAHVTAHATIVGEKARLRWFIGACQRAAAEGYGDIGGTLDEFIGQHEQSIHSLLRGVPGRNEPRRINAIITDVVGDVSEECRRRASNTPSRKTVGTRYPLLDDKLVGGGLMRGNLHVIGARPGMGKTSIATNLVCSICQPPTLASDPTFEHVEHAAFFWSGEMERGQLVLRMMCSESQVAFGAAARGKMSPDDWRRFMEAGAALDAMPIFIDDTSGITLSVLQAKIRDVRAQWERPADPAKGQRERRLSVVVVDYITLMRGTGREGNREQEVAGISKGLKETAKEFDVAVVALAQLNRAVEARGVKDRRPQLSDLRESGQIEQDADLIAFMHRPAYYDPGNPELRGIAELNFRKQRNGDAFATVFFWFDGPRMQFLTPTGAQMDQIADVYREGSP